MEKAPRWLIAFAARVCCNAVYHLPCPPHQRRDPAACIVSSCQGRENQRGDRLRVGGIRDASAKLAESDPGTTLTRERCAVAVIPISHGWQNTPIHLVGCHVDLDARTKGVAGAARNSPHGLVQILLNRSDVHLWGGVSKVFTRSGWSATANTKPRSRTVQAPCGGWIMADHRLELPQLQGNSS